MSPNGGRPPAASGDGSPAWVELVRFLPDVGRLLVTLGRDPRVPWQAKAVALATAAYVASPIDLVPDFIPGVGQMDDLVIITQGLRFLLKRAGYPLVREAWGGTEDGFTLLLRVTKLDR